MSADVFREGAAGVFVGPDGSRAVVIALLLSNSRVAIRQSWVDANNLMDHWNWNLDNDYDRDAQIEGMAAPEGCVEATRIEGSSFYEAIVGAATMCAVDPDLVFLVYLNGAVDINGTQVSGVSATDALVSTILSSTPTN